MCNGTSPYPSAVRGETFIGRRGDGATLNGRPIRVSAAKKLTEGIVGVGYSPRVAPDDFLPMFGRLLRGGRCSAARAPAPSRSAPSPAAD